MEEHNYTVYMHKNKIIKELEYFKGIEFHEKEHFYTLDDYRFGISATSLIETYAQEFDSDSISQKVAEKEGITQKEVLDKWKKENEFSCVKGSHIHLKSQAYWKNEDYKLDYNKIPDTIDKERLKKEYDIMSKQAINFYNDYKDMYDMIQDEFIVWSKEFDIAGSIDGIMYNKYTQQCCILDFKSNKDLQFESKYHKKMKVPLHKLDDVNGQHYYIQLSIYKYLIEKYTNIKIDELFIVYFNINANNYEIIPIPYMEKEVEEILENRRVIGMKSIPVLLYGKSGSGKTSSFRNYKNDEIAYINILDKPLPFKSDIKINSLDKYEMIIAGIKGTKKKTIVIDDAGFLLTNEMFERARETGYTKFTQIAEKFYNLIKEIKKIDGGKVVVISMHEEIEEGQVKLKTAGKMIESNGVIEGNFTIAIRTMCDNGKYVFRLKNTGYDITKTPIGLFDDGVEEIENDFKIVDKAIREYYELDKVEEKEEEK